MKIRLVGLCLTLIMMVTVTALGQVGTGSISGTVRDASGGVLPGAEIVVLNEDTGTTRRLVSGSAGRYNVPSLALGRYRVTASLDGFQTEVRSGIVLTVARQAVVNFDLEVGAITQTVEVTGEAPLVDTVSGSLGDLVESQEISELPLNGRDLAQLITLQTGTLEFKAGRREGGKLLSVSGGRTTANVFLIDGVVVEDFTRKTPTGASGSFLGVEAVREFRVQTNAYSSEFGRGAGGTFNIVTKSGTNAFHGSAFEFLRNDNLDARNFFDPDAPPEFKRNQFGGSIGGPVVRDKTFFFATYEGLRERLGQTIISETLTDGARQGDLDGDGQPDVSVDQAIAPYLSLYPRPNGRLFGDGTGEFLFPFSQPTDEDFVQGRIDHNFSDNDSLFGRYTLLDSTQLRVEELPAFRRGTETRNQSFVLEEKHIFSPALLASFRFGFSRTKPDETVEQDNVDPSLYFVPGVDSLGDLDISGVVSVGQGDSGESRIINSFQYASDFFYSTGNHTFKFGFNANRIQFNAFQPARDAANFRFPSLERFLINRPNRFRGAISEGFNDPWRSFRNTLYAAYVQDDVQLRPGLTLNLGVRYELNTAISEKHGRVANLRGDIDFIQSAAYEDLTLGNPWFETPGKRNFAPRVGMAWDVFGDGTTSVRSGFGIFFLHIDSAWSRTMGFRMPPALVETQSRRNISFPDFAQICRNENPFNPQNSACTGAPAVNFIPFNARTSYMMQYNFNIQRQLMPSTVLTLGYSGSRGVALPALADLNIADVTDVGGRLISTSDERPNGNWDDLRLRYPGASSAYNALQVGLNRLFSDGVQFRVSYTYSKNIDDISGSQSASDTDAGPNFIPVYHLRTLRRSRSILDATNVFSFSGTYELPIGSGKAIGSALSGAANTLLSGWQLRGIVTLRDGTPGTVGTELSDFLDDAGQRFGFLDAEPGADLNPIDPGNPDRYLNASGFQPPPSEEVFGNVGRNTITLPGLANVDLTLAKNTFLSETANLEFRFEIFNLFNRANFGVPDIEEIVFDSNNDPIGDTGRIRDTSTTSRQLQFGLRLTF